MIPGHGAQLSVTESNIRLHYSPLFAALHGPEPTIAVGDITEVTLVEPTAYLGGHVLLRYTPEGGEPAELAVPFAPQRSQEAREFAAAVEAARKGEPVAEGAQPATPSTQGLSFSAINVVRCNPHQESICQIGVATVRDGVLRSHTQWECRPPEGMAEVDPRMAAVYGASAEEWAARTTPQGGDLPRVDEVWPEIAKAVGKDVLVAHRAQVDMAALRAAWEATHLPVPEYRFGCTHILALHAGLPLERTRLADLCEHLGVDYPGHRDAETGAVACAQVLLALAELLHPDATRLTVEELFASHDLLLGITTADALYPVLKDSFHRARSAREEKGDNGSADPAIPDSRLIASPPDESGGAGTDFRSGGGGAGASRSGRSGRGAQRRGDYARRSSPRWSRVAQPDTVPKPNEDADPQNELYGQDVTLSGDFTPYDKAELWSAIANRGARIGKNVTKKTTLLIAGPWGKKTSKHKRAEELQEQGQDIRIWSADQLYSVLGLTAHVDEEPPF